MAARHEPSACWNFGRLESRNIIININIMRINMRRVRWGEILGGSREERYGVGIWSYGHRNTVRICVCSWGQDGERV